jgi:DNA-binding NarL/FixJ family response regulator
MSEPGVQPSDKPEASRALRVVIVDDHPMVREFLSFALLSVEDIEVVGAAADGEEALQLCGDLHPDVVIMDLRLSGRLSSAETIRTLLRPEGPLPQVLLHTAVYDERLVSEALAAGACGYVPKEGDLTPLVAAIRAASGREQAKA